MEADITMSPIGVVRNAERAPRYTGWEEIVSTIVLRPELADALDGIDEFSHLLVLVWLERVSPADRRRRRVHPRSRPDLPLVGMLATHTQYRPNPIGVTIVELVRREGIELTVRGLDALDGTPVLDLKPWLPDSRPSGPVRVPEWVRRLSAQPPP